jgi:hypothetical protein
MLGVPMDMMDERAQTEGTAAEADPHTGAKAGKARDPYRIYIEHEP